MEILKRSNCLDCHAFSGSGLEERVPEGSTIVHQVMAPDLAHVRNRLSLDILLKWLDDPVSIKKDAIMPKTNLSEEERVHVSAALFHHPLLKEEVKPLVPLSNLERSVFYAEVEHAVFKKICWHCHSKPSDVNGGDAGPGNTGGFGYAGVKLDLGSYEGILHGKGGQSILETKDGEESLLVQVLLQRHTELNANTVDVVLGMPLGLEPLSMEDIQLVRTWVAQGARKE